MARPRRKLGVAHVLERPAHRGLVKDDVILVMQPGDEITQAPAHHAVDIGNRTGLDGAGQSGPLLGVQARRRAW